MVQPGFEIKALAPDLLQDFLNFFESVEFRDHPDWSVCYCYSFHFTGNASQWTRENNRAGVIRMISAGQMSGYLAYHQGIAVGWCNVNDRNNYQRMIQYKDIMEPCEEKICSIVCFVVHPDYRRQGIATRFLERVEYDYRSKGYHWLEAYPGKGNLGQEDHYMGPLPMYLSRGFEITRESDKYYLLRKRLKEKPEN
jgi:GNAT superfamily N-acetyltransferase